MNHDRMCMQHCCLATVLQWLRSTVGGTPVFGRRTDPVLRSTFRGRVTTMWVNRPLKISQLGQLSLSSFRDRKMSSELQLDVCHLNLVNAYEVRQAWCLLQVKLCDPCLSALKWSVYHARRYTSARLFFTSLWLCDCVIVRVQLINH